MAKSFKSIRLIFFLIPSNNLLKKKIVIFRLNRYSILSTLEIHTLIKKKIVTLCIFVIF